MMHLKLITERLELIPLTLEQLSWYLEDEQRFAAAVGDTSRVILTDTLERAIRMKLEKMAGRSPEDQLWLTYWLIKLPEIPYGIGMLGFKGIPDYLGQAEIGYGIDPAYQNQGYTTEAAGRMIRWAFEDPRCERVIAPGTRKDNPASNRVLEKLGLKVYEERADSLSWAITRQDFLLK